MGKMEHYIFLYQLVECAHIHSTSVCLKISSPLYFHFSFQVAVSVLRYIGSFIAPTVISSVFL